MLLLQTYRGRQTAVPFHPFLYQLSKHTPERSILKFDEHITFDISRLHPPDKSFKAIADSTCINLKHSSKCEYSTKGAWIVSSTFSLIKATKITGTNHKQTCHVHYLSIMQRQRHTRVLTRIRKAVSIQGICRYKLQKHQRPNYANLMCIPCMFDDSCKYKKIRLYYLFSL